MKSVLLFIILHILLANSVNAKSTVDISPKRLSKLDKYAKSTTYKHERNIQTLADYLMKPAKNDVEKARLIFSWIAFHIKYDARAFNSGKYGDLSAEGVLKSRKAVCTGFANLFQALCDASGLEAITISGYAKGYGYKPNQEFQEIDHTWNVVKTDGIWKFMDATWGQGYGEQKHGRMIATIQFDDYWFAPNPKEFIFTHFPEDSEWQLLSDPISKYQFKELTSINQALFKFGFNADSILNHTLHDNKFQFVAVNDIGASIEIISSPLQYEIHQGESITWRIKCGDAIELAAKNNDTWTLFKKKGDLFELTLSPETGILFICARFQKRDRRYCSFLRYKIVSRQ